MYKNPLAVLPLYRVTVKNHQLQTIRSSFLSELIYDAFVLLPSCKQHYSRYKKQTLYKAVFTNL